MTDTVPLFAEPAFRSNVTVNRSVVLDPSPSAALAPPIENVPFTAAALGLSEIPVSPAAVCVVGVRVAVGPGVFVTCGVAALVADPEVGVRVAVGPGVLLGRGVGVFVACPARVFELEFVTPLGVSEGFGVFVAGRGVVVAGRGVFVAGRGVFVACFVGVRVGWRVGVRVGCWFRLPSWLSLFSLLLLLLPWELLPGLGVGVLRAW